ncbi:MAG TPA: elongation factor G, partial [Candidatus Omnitrophota bacterium]|nr:elongation factor G [Candidatus Omnitrophota bacterium]
MAVSTDKIRNVALVAHSGAGKTTLIENILCKGGAISKPGTIDAGTTVCDYSDDEKERKNSINLSTAFYERNGLKVNLLDTPGYLDYAGEVAAGVNAADAVILIVDAVSGIQVGTLKFWKMAQELKLPALVVVGKMDKDNANFDKVIASLKTLLGKGCVALCYPSGKGSGFSAIADLLTKKGMENLQAEDKKKAEEMSANMTEGVAESDDALLEKYLDKGELSPEEIKSAFRKGVISGKVIPVIPVSVEKGIGVEEIMLVIENYFPSPDEMPAVKASMTEAHGDPVNVEIEPREDQHFSAQVFKTISDPYAGQISIFRVRSGKIASNLSVRNSSRGSSEKLGQLFFLRGKEQVHADTVISGDIAAVAKLKDTHTSDTLCDEKHPVVFGKISFPEPAVSFSVKPKSRSDEDKISGVLTKLAAEDPVFKWELDPQTHEMIVSGMGDLHLKTMISRMKQRYGVDVEIGTPKIAYKETITGKGDAQYRHKKQSGGAGQFAEVWLKVEPLARGEGFQFVDEVVGGAIPRQFIGSCEKGILNAMKEGSVAGFPVIDVRVTVYDGKTHPVDSKDIAFQIAAAHGFREACNKAKPVILEPVMNVELTIPEENMGDVTGSLSSRRGRVQGMDSESGMQTLRAQIPLE